MIELIFVVCLNATPAVCEERAMQFTDLTATGCALHAQPQLAKWAETHPKWQVARWKCQPMGSRQQSI